MSEEETDTTEKKKFCPACEKDVIPESRKEYMGWLIGLSIKEKYCPECGMRLTANTRYGMLACCLVAFIAVMTVLILSGIPR